MSLSQALLWFAVLVGAGIAVVALILVPVLFVPVVFPMFKLFGESASIATALAVCYFANIPSNAYAISSITGTFRAGGDVIWGTALDLIPQWLICIPITALVALKWQLGAWPIAIAIQLECLVKVPPCILRTNSGKWIHDVTISHKEEVRP
jgi:Na+-driven multidrug efflux pump